MLTNNIVHRLRIPTGGAILLLITGCTALPPQPEGKLFERNGVSMVVVPANSRETYFSDPKSPERHCRAPSPDFSVTASEGFSLSASLPTPAGGKGAGVSDDATQGSLSLGGRNPAVLITRELMYRACELANNLNLNPAETLKLYRDVMNIIVQISSAQSGTGAAAAVATPAAAQVTATPAATAPATTSSDPTTSSTSSSGSSSWGTTP